MKLTKLLYSFLFLFLVVLIWIWGGSFRKIFHKNKIFMEKVGQVVAVQKENKRLEQENAALKDSSFMLEKLAREEYGMGKPSEKIYFLNTSKKQDKP